RKSVGRPVAAGHAANGASNAAPRRSTATTRRCLSRPARAASYAARRRDWSSFQRTSRSRSAGRLGLETLVESSLSGKARRNTGISGREPGSTSSSLHGVGDLFTALRREGLIADELVLQLATLLRSLDLFLELIVL